MDAKALAKSKRAHTQHHKKHHPNQKPKAAPVTGRGGDVKKTAGDRVPEKSQKPRGSPALPSNWERYSEEVGSDGEDPSGGSSSMPPDVTLPKSKGADYGHLIAEARAQADLSLSFDSFPSLVNEFLGDLSWGLGALLSVRGEDLLSRAENDNFIVDDKAISSHEASLISLNLRALAEKLEKVDMSERLYLEADLLPPELHSKSSSNHSANQEKIACKNSAGTSEFKELVLNEEDINSLGKSSTHPMLSDEELISVDHIDIDPGHDSKVVHSIVPHTAIINAQEPSLPDGKRSTFEASAAESELDMLLGSFSEVTEVDTSGFRSVEDFQCSSKQEASTGALQPKGSRDPFELAITSGNLDDDLDALLDQTSNSTNLNSFTEPQKINAPPSTQSPSICSKSKQVKGKYYGIDSVTLVSCESCDPLTKGILKQDDVS